MELKNSAIIFMQFG